MRQNSACFVILGVIFSVTCVGGVSPIACRENEQLGSCGKVCEGKCENPNLPKCGPQRPCDFVDCQCKPGFYRNNDTKACVRLSECPKPKCKPNEIMAPCGKDCEGTCPKPYRPEKCKLIKCAKQGCQCDLSRGYVRDLTTGNCTRNQDNKKCAAELKCPRNSKPKLCGGICQATCRDQDERQCKLDTTRCVVNCHCDKNYVKNELTGECVRCEQCPRDGDSGRYRQYSD